MDKEPPPHDIEIEMAALGAMIINSDTIPVARSEICAEHFYNLRHQKIFTLICDIYDEHGTVDMVVLKKTSIQQEVLGSGGANQALIELTEACGVSSNIEWYCNKIKASHKRRQLLKAGQYLLNNASDEDVDITLQKGRDLLDSVESTDSPDEVSAYDAWCKTLENMADKDNKSMVHFGVEEIDDMVDMESGDVVVLGGESGAGKSSLLYHLIWDAGNRGKKTLLFSAEIMAHKVMRRMMCQVCSVDTRRAKSRRLEPQEFERMSEVFDDKTIRNMGLTINDKIADIEKITSRAIAKAQTDDIDVIAIDHAQHLTVRKKGRGGVRDAEVIAPSAKKIARQTGCLVVLLSQVTELPDGGWRFRGGDEYRNVADFGIIIRYPGGFNFGEEADDPDTVRNIVVAKGRDVGQGNKEVPFYGPYLQFGESRHSVDRFRQDH